MDATTATFTEPPILTDLRIYRAHNYTIGRAVALAPIWEMGAAVGQPAKIVGLAKNDHDVIVDVLVEIGKKRRWVAPEAVYMSEVEAMRTTQERALNAVFAIDRKLRRLARSVASARNVGLDKRRAAIERARCVGVGLAQINAKVTKP